MTPLFAQKQSGDRVFERVYRAHVQDVYRYALMVLRNPADAEDAVQTTFMKAYRAFQRGNTPRQPRPWLIAIAHNTCRSRLRDAQRRPQEVELEERLVATTDGGSDGVDPHELVHALGALSFNQRAALVMRELEGRSYAEIADVLQVSNGAVETLIFRARRALREQLEGTLTCGEAEYALSLQLDGRLPKAERGRLRAHLRECGECASLARRQRARRAALRSLGPLPLPASLTSWGGGTAGAGLAFKAAAVVAASVAATGAGLRSAEAVPEPKRDARTAQVARTAAAPAPIVRAAPDRNAGAAVRTAQAKRRKALSPGAAAAVPGAVRASPASSRPTAAPQRPAAAPILEAPVSVPPLPVQLPEPPALPLPPVPVAPPPLPVAPPPLPVEPPPLPVEPPQLPQPPPPPELPPVAP